MTPTDHVIATVLVLFMPVYGRWSWRRLERDLARKPETARLTDYASTIIIEWTLALTVLIAWVSAGRPLATLGLQTRLDGPFVSSLALASAAGVFLILQVWTVMRVPEAAARARRQVTGVSPLLPHTAGERDVFLALSTTAGFCEELLYRGFLMGYLEAYLGRAAAVIASSAIFGLLHAYQGPAGALRTGVVGLAMASIYAVSGSIWPAVLLHTAIDVQGGLIGYVVVGRNPARSRP